MVKKETIDWQKVIKMVFLRKDWGRIYTLYSCQTTSITAVMRDFDFEQSTAWFTIKVKYNIKKTFFESEDRYVNYHLNNFSIDDFQMVLRKRIITLLNYILDSEIRNEARTKYINLFTLIEDITDKDVDEAGFGSELVELNNMSGMFQDDCRTKLLEEVQDVMNANFTDKVSDYVLSYKIVISGLNEIKEELEAENGTD